MIRVLVLSGFLMAVGLAAAGVTTYLYQWLFRQEAQLRYDGATFWRFIGTITVSLFSGPFLMLQMGWRQERGGTLTMSMALFAAFLAFGWAFVTGLLIVGCYLALIG